MLYFTVYKSNNLWRFNIRLAGKSEVLASSESYRHKQDVLSMIGDIRQAATSSCVLDLTTHKLSA